MDIHQHRARGVADIRDMRGAAGKLENQPTIDRAGGEFAGSGAGVAVGDLAKNPMQLAGGKIRVEKQPSAALNQRLLARIAQGGHVVRGAAVLPDDGAVNGFAGLAIPHHNGFPLICDANRREGFWIDAGFLHSLARGRKDGVADFLGVVLHPARLGEMLLKFLLRGGEGSEVFVVNDRPGARGALVEGEDVFHGEI